MIPRLATLAFSTFALLLLVQPAAAEDKIDPTFRKSVTQYLKIQGVAPTLGDQMTYAMADQMLGAVAASGVDVTQTVQDIVLAETRKQFGNRFGDVEFLTDIYAPIYAEHFSQKELQELIDFWGSPIGKKAIKVTPLMAQATQAAIQSAAEELIPMLQQNVETRLTGAGLAPAKP
jgi:hypothetical protein